MSDPFSEDFDGILSNAEFQRLASGRGAKPHATDPTYAGKGRRNAQEKKAAEPVQLRVETLLGQLEILCKSYKPAREKTAYGWVYFHTLDVAKTLQTSLSPEDYNRAEVRGPLQAQLESMNIRTFYPGFNYADFFKKQDR